jgi:hypothetical protein
MSTLTFNELEQVYESVALAIDTAGAEKRDVFLAKLVLLLARDIGNQAHVLSAIEDCLKDL